LGGEQTPRRKAMNNLLQRVLNVKELADVLNISEFTVRRLARENQIPSLVRKGRYQFEVKELVRFFKELEGAA
jgi:excisionase family DNA binding protein